MNSIKVILLAFVSFYLFGCYNPVEPSFSIRIIFDVSSSNQVSLHIFSSTGVKVRTLIDRTFSSGVHSVQWDGLNFEGEDVVEGIYYYQIEYWDGDTLTDIVIERFIVH